MRAGRLGRRLPEGLVADDLRDGRLALASRDPAWHLPIELRVYRHRGDGRPVVGKLWDALKTMGEGVGVAHDGRNAGTEPVKLLVFYTGIEGKPNVAKAARPAATPPR